MIDGSLACIPAKHSLHTCLSPWCSDSIFFLFDATTILDTFSRDADLGSLALWLRDIPPHMVVLMQKRSIPRFCVHLLFLPSLFSQFFFFQEKTCFDVCLMPRGGQAALAATRTLGTTRVSGPWPTVRLSPFYQRWVNIFLLPEEEICFLNVSVHAILKIGNFLSSNPLHTTALAPTYIHQHTPHNTPPACANGSASAHETNSVSRTTETLQGIGKRTQSCSSTRSHGTRRPWTDMEIRRTCPPRREGIFFETQAETGRTREQHTMPVQSLLDTSSTKQENFFLFDDTLIDTAICTHMKSIVLQGTPGP